MALRRTHSSTPSTPSFKPDAVDFAKTYAFHHLLDSPLPSPALPSIIPRHGKKPPPKWVRSSLRWLVRLCTWIGGVGLVCWIASTVLGNTKLPAAVSDLSSDGEAYEWIAEDSVPLEATPVVVTDRRGKTKWTVSIPPSLEFPLKPSDYANICPRSDEISDRLQRIKSGSARIGGSFRYDHKDPNFVDIKEAEWDGLLPAVRESATRKALALEVVKGLESGNQKRLQAEGKNGVCGRSLTYALETADAGLGKTLMGLWMAYGLAKAEGRAFFIDDTDWYSPVVIRMCM